MKRLISVFKDLVGNILPASVFWMGNAVLANGHVFLKGEFCQYQWENKCTCSFSPHWKPEDCCLAVEQYCFYGRLCFYTKEAVLWATSQLPTARQRKLVWCKASQGWPYSPGHMQTWRWRNFPLMRQESLRSPVISQALDKFSPWDSPGVSPGLLRLDILCAGLYVALESVSTSEGITAKERFPWLLQVSWDLSGPSLELARAVVQLLSLRSSSQPVIPPPTQCLASLVSLAYISGLTPEQLDLSVTKTELHLHSNTLLSSIFTLIISSKGKQAKLRQLSVSSWVF